ncbi:ABC transporter ATP-binding protein [Actinomadura oligospora]|uniref:ABC transporter ATP-binding protein n=1 Tax=Actinomadura oligospora TaxID=111804 RepID=UPI0004B11468|nr:ABC transporter ATP-binding protein [Actinomadura oligospora]
MARLVVAAVRLVWAASRREFIVVVLMDLTQAVGVFFLVVQLQQLLSGLMDRKDGGANTLALGVVGFVGANILVAVAEAVIANRRQLLSERTSLHVCRQIMTVACLADLADFDDSRFHDRLYRAATSALTRPSRMVESLVTVGQVLFTLLAVAVAMIVVQPWIALFVVLAAIPVWLGGVRGGEQHFDFVEETTEDDRSRTYLFELLTKREPAKEIRAFNLERYLARRWVSIMEHRLALLAANLRRRFVSALLASVGSGLVLALAAGVLIALNRWAGMSLAETATTAGALLVFSQKLVDGIGAGNEFFESAPLVRDLESFLALRPEVERGRPGGTAPAEFGSVDFEDVSFTYQGAERPALEEVSLRIGAGEVVALVGENGSGKTTLAKLLAGLYAPGEGRILVDGADLADYDPATWRDTVAVLFQDFIRYALPAEDNIRIGAAERDPDDDAIRAAAKAAGADAFLSALPDGYATILSPQFGTGQDLSLGQWQRVALARAFLRAAPLVVLDEPSASLDARAERALFDSVRELYDGRTVLLISHRFSTVRTADRIVVLRSGRVAEQGTHDELMATGGLYAELFTLQARGYLAPGDENGRSDPGHAEDRTISLY